MCYIMVDGPSETLLFWAAHCWAGLTMSETPNTGRMCFNMCHCKVFSSTIMARPMNAVNTQQLQPVNGFQAL